MTQVGKIIMIFSLKRINLKISIFSIILTALYSACSGGNSDTGSASGSSIDSIISSDRGGANLSEESFIEETGYMGQYLGADYFSEFTGDPDNNLPPEDAEDYIAGTDGEDGPVLSYGKNDGSALTGRTNGNSMYSLWKAEKMMANYLYSGNVEDEFGRYLSDSVNIYYYFDEDNAYRIFRFDSAGPYYINSAYSRLYSYNKTTNEILMVGIARGGFYPDGDRAVLSYFNLVDGKQYCYLLGRMEEIKGEIKNVTDDEFKIKMWGYYAKEELSIGDGRSKGAIDVTIDYKGKKIISERSPIVALLKNAFDEKFTPVAGNAVTSKSDNKVRISGIPDGKYLLYAIRINDIIKNSDPEPGDVYTIYDNTFYGGPPPAVIPIEKGNYHSLLVSLDDSHSLPPEIKGSPVCGLSAVDCLLRDRRLTVSVNINTDAFDDDPSVSLYCYSPSACAYNHARFENGQKIEIGLERRSKSSVWAGEAVLEDYNESGRWKIGMIQVRGTAGGAVRHAGYSMADGERLKDFYIYYDWSAGEGDVKLGTGIRVKSFDFKSGNSDLTGPKLVAVDTASIPGGKIEFSVTVENSGPSGHRLQDFSMDLFPVQLFLFHREVPPLTIDDAFTLEFRDLPEINGDYAVYKAELDTDELPGYGAWDVKAVQLIDFAGNNSFYFIYNDDIYSGIFNFWGNGGTYSLYNFGPELPAQTELEMVSVEKKPEPDIYISGYYNMDSKFSRFPDDEQIPCVWKNGTMTELGRSYKIFACPASIFISNDNVYAAGYAYSESDPMFRGRIADQIPCLWKDGKVTYLSEEIFGRANSVFVYGGRIYAAGYYRNGAGRYVACLWIDDGKSVTLIDIAAGAIKDDYPTQAASVFVSSDVVYVAGSVTDGAERIACLWKYDADGRQIESDKLAAEGFNDFRPSSLFVLDNDFYVAVDYKNHEQLKTAAALWINSGQTVLADDPGAAARSVYVSDGTAYICGDYAVSKTARAACVWEATDGGITERRLYPQGNSRAFSVFVSQGDVYAAGSHEAKDKPGIENTACFWKNGDTADLSGYGNHNAGAESIYVRVKKQ